MECIFTWEAELLLIFPRIPHICWNCTRISLNVSVITAIKTFFTSHAKKKIRVLKYDTAIQAGNESIALYIIKTQPSWDAAW